MKKQLRKKVTKKNKYILRYVEMWNFIKESKNLFYFILSIFIIGFILGFVYPEIYAEALMKIIREIMQKTRDLGFIQMLAFIISNNVKTSFMGLILGIAFGVFPIFIAVFNGYLLGFVFNKLALEDGLSNSWKILPHGIFELPAFFLSLSLGLRLSYSLFFTKDFKVTLKNCLEIFVLIIIPLLLLAGIIETGLIFLFK